MSGTAKILALAAGSLAGGFSRYFLAGLVQRLCGPVFPYGTMVVNLSGCFLIGFLSAAADGRTLLGPTGRILLMVGFCGAFTTFSSWMLETDALVRDGEILRAFWNLALSVAGGFVLFRTGAALGQLI